jgi:hypothetical protein
VQALGPRAMGLHGGVEGEEARLLGVAAGGAEAVPAGDRRPRDPKNIRLITLIKVRPMVLALLCYLVGSALFIIGTLLMLFEETKR